MHGWGMRWFYGFLALFTGCGLGQGTATELAQILQSQDSEALDRLLTERPGLASQPVSVPLPRLTGGEQFKILPPLIYATTMGDQNCVAVLLRHGAKVNAVDEYGATGLHAAAQSGFHKIVNALLDARANVEARNVIGLAPLKAAAVNDELECAKILLARGADVNSVTKYRESGLHNVRSVEMASLLLQSGIDVNIRDREGNTALHNAVVNGFADVAVLLIERGADVKLRNAEGKTAIDVARKESKPEILSRILAAAGVP